MAIVEDQVREKEFAEWLQGRPQVVQELATKFPPWRLFRIKATGDRVFAVGYGEDGTLTVYVSGRFNFVAFERRVFGVPPEALEECELPGPGEKVGAVFTEEEEIRELLDALRDRMPGGAE